MARVSKSFLTVLMVAGLLLGLAAGVTASGPDGPYIQARVEFASMADWYRFVNLEGMDVMKSKPGLMVEIVTNDAQIEELRALGFGVEVEIEDMAEFYASRVRGPNFGDFHTFSETIDFIDGLTAAYPSIVGEKISIGTSIEGRDVWAIKISDNPGVDETEPEILLDGLHHAREPMSVEVLLHYMTWLTSNYGTDPEATFLVDNREIWFVPVVNPDGYCYNELTDPGGGGMWRKNRRNNAGSSCYGVDPNRNYDYEWGGVGSSGDPCSETYRGTAPHSEPCIQAYVSFVEAREFVTNITFHSVAGMVLLPWGYTNAHTPDDATFRVLANNMAQYNGYQVGQAGEILYNCSGTTPDWAYGVEDIWSLCVEVAGTGFWPAESEIPSLNAENLWPQQYICRVAGSYLAVDGTTFAGGNGDQQPDAGETLDLVVSIENQGVIAGATNVSVVITTDDPYVQLHDASTTLGSISAGSAANNSGDPFSFSVDAGTPDGHGLVLTLEITGDGLYMEETLSWMVGEPTVVFFDDMESGTGNWVENDGYWGLTSTQSHSPSTSYTDSPSGNYGSYRNTWIELATAIDFSSATAADLSFWHRVDTEADYDYCYVEASSDGGGTWYQVGPKYHGNNYGWEEVELSLNDFVGTANFSLRFRFTSDTYVEEDGWYVDDVTISGPPTGNVKPTEPTLSDPPDGGTVSSPTPDLTVVNSYDPDPGDVLTYGFQVYDDELCTSLVASMSGVTEGSGTTSWTVSSSLGSGTYYWRTYADDGTERSQLMATASFIVEETGVQDAGIATLVLHPSRPNPFGREASLSFELPTRANVTFDIYSVNGRLVRTLVDDEMDPGTVDVMWDGRDEHGRRVGNGLYFMKLVAGDDVRRGKVIVLR